MSAPRRAYIGVGSNIAPQANIVRALAMLGWKARLKAVSTFYQTPALGRPEQADYVNGVCEIETAREPLAFQVEVLREIETSLGRVRTADRCAARTMDLDLLLMGDAVLRVPGLALPSPDIRTRPFVALPLLELDPQLKLPDDGARLADLASTLDASGMKPLGVFTAHLRKELGL